MSFTALMQDLMSIFDAHVHFVDPDRAEGVVWPQADSSAYGRRMPPDLLDSSRGFTVAGCVAVEASRRQADDDWLIRLAEEEALVQGVVLNLQPDAPGFESRLRRCQASEFFLGVRFRPVDDYDLESVELHRSIELLQQAGKTIEFGAKTPALKQSFTRLAAQFSGSTWLLDHCGHPQPDAQRLPEWHDGIAAIAELPNTVCKITSGYCDPAIWAPVLQQLDRHFGPDRLLYGSNWPVCAPATDLGESVRQLRSFFGRHSQQILEDNARRAYGVGSESVVNGIAQR